MSDSRRAVVIGGSSGVGRALAEELAGAGFELIISARHDNDLHAVASDLQLRHATTVIPLVIDLCGTDQALDEYFRTCTGLFPSIDAVLFPAGMTNDADDGTSSWEVSESLVTTNFLAVLKLAGRFIERFEQQGRGTTVLFSSIAAAAPRSRNVAYSAAKRALESYGRSMQHRLADGHVSVQIYRLGYIDTARASGRTLLLPPAAPSRLAREVIGHIDGSHRIAHFPRYWRIIVFILGRLPWTIYRRLKF